ncbi:uncharacterized protein [Oscarella lobularis]|uniref:uncharacterized protein isoform X2 n=1 Tax=Oscarella lobularis TaxID=121494 RepID=UPI0033138CB5
MGAGAQLACSTRSRDRSMIMTSLLVCAFLCVASSSSSLNAASLDDDVVELATYNTGLLPTIPRLGERFEALLNELPKLTADVLCLQELWTEAVLLAVVDASSSAFPYRLRLETHDSASPPCNRDALRAAFACAAETCPRSSAASRRVPVELFLCALSDANCRRKFHRLGQRCMNCLILGPSFELPDHPFSCSEDASHSYSTTNGLLLLSKRPLLNTIASNFTWTGSDDVELITRGYLSAEIDGVGTIVCTHLPTYYSTLEEPYIGPSQFKNIKEEHVADIDVLFSRYVENRRRTHLPPVVFMGDFNHGPVIGQSVAAEFPELFQEVIERGYVSTPATRREGCSYCKSNSIVPRDYLPGTETNASTSAVGVLIDHVYFPSEIDFDYLEIKKLDVSSEGPLSDHYGISVSFCIRGTV